MKPLVKPIPIPPKLGFGLWSYTDRGLFVTAFLHSFSVEGDDNTLGLFWAKAHFLGDLPPVKRVLLYEDFNRLATYINLAKELNLQASAVLSNGEELYA